MYFSGDVDNTHSAASSVWNPSLNHFNGINQVNSGIDDKKSGHRIDIISNRNSVPMIQTEGSWLSSPNGSSQHIFQDAFEESKRASPWPVFSGHLIDNQSKPDKEPVNLNEVDKVKKLTIFGFDLINHSSISRHEEKSPLKPINLSKGTNQGRPSTLSVPESDQKSDLSNVSKERVSGPSPIQLEESQTKQIYSNSSRSRTKVMTVKRYLYYNL